MTIDYQFGDVDARGALIRMRAEPSEAALQAVVRDVPAAALRAGPLMRTRRSVTFRSSAEMHLVNSQQATASARPGCNSDEPQNIRLSNLLIPI